MELNKIEIERLKEVVEIAPSVELQELQLAFVGGGIGETVL
jgi:hypothetical protein